MQRFQLTQWCDGESIRLWATRDRHRRVTDIGVPSTLLSSPSLSQSCLDTPPPPHTHTHTYLTTAAVATADSESHHSCQLVKNSGHAQTRTGTAGTVTPLLSGRVTPAMGGLRAAVLELSRASSQSPVENMTLPRVLVVDPVAVTDFGTERYRRCVA